MHTISVFGSGCPTCKNLTESLKTLVAKNNFPAKIEYSTDTRKMLETGAMQSPVVLFDGEILFAGRPPTDLEKILAERFSL